MVRVLAVKGDRVHMYASAVWGTLEAVACRGLVLRWVAKQWFSANHRRGSLGVSDRWWPDAAFRLRMALDPNANTSVLLVVRLLGYGSSQWGHERAHTAALTAALLAPLNSHRAF